MNNSLLIKPSHIITYISIIIITVNSICENLQWLQVVGCTVAHTDTQLLDQCSPCEDFPQVVTVQSTGLPPFPTQSLLHLPFHVYHTHAYGGGKNKEREKYQEWSFTFSVFIRPPKQNRYQISTGMSHAPLIS